MVSYNQQDLVARLYKSRLKIFTINSLKVTLGVKNEQTFYSVIKKLVKSKILERIEGGKYLMVDNPPGDFYIANFLCQPSYVSFETALNYHGILSQFPYETTSATIKKSQSKIFNGKVYGYVHLKHNLYWGYEKIDDYLIATPEKALLDQLYLASKGLKRTDFSEYDFKIINKRVFWDCAKKFGNLEKFARQNLKI